MEQQNIPSSQTLNSNVQLSSNNNKKLIVIGVALLLVVGSGSYFLGVRSQQNKQKEMVKILPTNIIEISPTVKPKEMKVAVISIPPIANSPTVAYLFSPIEQEKKEIEEKIIQPLAEHRKKYVVAIEVKKITDKSSSYDYSILEIDKNGGTGGFLAKKTNGVLDWYAPECGVGGPCLFTKVFAQKYPMIVNNYIKLGTGKIEE